MDEIARRASTVTDEQSSLILTLLTEKAADLPLRPDHFDKPSFREHNEELIEKWDYEMSLLQIAISNGGQLWRWSTSTESWKNMCGRAGLAVVQGGRVVACNLTAMN